MTDDEMVGLSAHLHGVHTILAPNPPTCVYVHAHTHTPGVSSSRTRQGCKNLDQGKG